MRDDGAWVAHKSSVRGKVGLSQHVVLYELLGNCAAKFATVRGYFTLLLLDSIFHKFNWHISATIV